MPGQALHRDPPARRPGHGRPRDLRRHRRPAQRPDRRPVTTAGQAGRPATRRARPHPAHRPRGQAVARLGTGTTEATRPRCPLDRMAAPPPGTITLVPPTRTPGTQLRPGQLAIGRCRTSAIRRSAEHPRQNNVLVHGCYRSIAAKVPLTLSDPYSRVRNIAHQESELLAGSRCHEARPVWLEPHPQGVNIANPWGI